MMPHGHMNEGSYDIMGESSLLCYHPTKFVGHRHCGSRDMFLICRVTSHYHTFTYVSLYEWKPLIASHHILKFDGLELVEL